jgi:flagellar biosynthesis GTPase FlhF
LEEEAKQAEEARPLSDKEKRRRGRAAEKKRREEEQQHAEEAAQQEKERLAQELVERQERAIEQLRQQSEQEERTRDMKQSLANACTLRVRQWCLQSCPNAFMIAYKARFQGGKAAEKQAKQKTAPEVAPDIRLMLMSLHTIFPRADGAAAPYDFAEGLSKDSAVTQVKKSYMKCLLVVHPDKVQVSQANSIERLILAQYVFDVLRSAYTSFTENPT